MSLSRGSIGAVCNAMVTGDIMWTLQSHLCQHNLGRDGPTGAPMALRHKLTKLKSEQKNLSSLVLLAPPLLDCEYDVFTAAHCRAATQKVLIFTMQKKTVSAFVDVASILPAFCCVSACVVLTAAHTAERPRRRR